MRITEAKRCLYTINFGGYDTLKEPAVVTKGWDYICYTDDANLKSDIWEMRVIDLKMPARLAARMVYIQSQLFLPEYKYSLMIGGQIRCDGDLNEFADNILDGGSLINLMKHPCRTCIYEEAKIVKRLNLCSEEVVNHQMDRYWKEGFPKDFGLSACGIIGRWRDESVAEFERLWWNEVVAGCHRDQLSFDYIRWKLKRSVIWVSYNILFGNFFSVYQRGTGKRIAGV